MLYFHREGNRTVDALDELVKCLRLEAESARNVGAKDTGLERLDVASDICVGFERMAVVEALRLIYEGGKSNC